MVVSVSVSATSTAVATAVGTDPRRVPATMPARSDRSAWPESVLIGRDAEVDELERRLDGIETCGAIAVLIGEPGVGKSALQAVSTASARRRGFTVLEARGSDAETQLPFASLHQLVSPMLAQVDQLSPRQRAALLAAFGLGESVAVEPFLISLAVLELVVDSARRTPVVISLDDMHWMDRSSLDTLAFLARRISGERVVMIGSTRVDAAGLLDDPGVVRLSVDSLEPDAAALLLDRTSPTLSATARADVLRESDGNPLALLEFPLVTAKILTGPEPAMLPMTARLERAFAGRAEFLPAASRAILAVAAVSGDGDLAEILAAAAPVAGGAIGLAAVQPAIDAGLLTSDGMTVQFRHPLVRSAVHQATPLTTRLAAHRVLADLLADQPDRAAWHRAEAATAPDEDLAAALEGAALRSQHRGAVLSAMSWLTRAAQLTPDESRRGARLLTAAELAFELGRFPDVEQLMARAAALPLAPRDRSRLTWLEGVFDDGTPGDPGEVRRLVGLADRAVAENDSDLAIQLLVGAARRGWWRDPGAEVRQAITVSAAAAGLSPADPRLLACLVVAEPMRYGRHVVEQLDSGVPGAAHRPEDAGLLGLAAFCAGDFGRATSFLMAPVEALRAQGRLGLLAQALTLRAWSAIYLGSFTAAGSAEEAVRLADETSQPVWAASARIAAALLAGIRGDDTGPDLLLAAGTVASAGPAPMSSLLSGIQIARGVTDLGAGRYEAAYTELRRIFDPREACHHEVQRFWSFSYLAEAAAHSGRRREGRALLVELEQIVGDQPCPAGEVGIFFAHAVLAQDEEADSWYRAALVGPGSEFPWHRARIELNYGCWLRRHRRTRDARPMLRSARQTFHALGAAAWSHRADRELRATGEKAWQPVPTARNLLSPQESQIAQLAAEGLSNKEISERLFLSHRTVGSHLYRMFPKLGITSRGQLSAALRAASADDSDLD